MVAQVQHSAASTAAGVRPSFEAVQEFAHRAGPDIRLVPVFRDVPGDLETPVSVYLKLTDGCRKPGFILESVEGGVRIARYSFIGAEPRSTITLVDGALTEHSADGETVSTYDDPLTALGQVMSGFKAERNPDLPRLTGGAIGYLSYDAIRRFEPRVPLASGAGLGYPEARFHIAESMVVFDHVDRSMKVVAHVHLDDPRGIEASYADAVDQIEALTERLRGAPRSYEMRPNSHPEPVVDRFRPNTSPERYRDIVNRAKQYIHEGDIFQVVLSQRLDVPTDAHPFTMYRALRMVNPSPYMFFLDFGEHQVVGASPELLVRLENGIVTNHPIAGTRPRGETPQEDAQNAIDLMADEKERAEHLMLVDLGRNDVGRVSSPGSVRVPKLMEIEHFSHVMHIVSHVEGEIAEGHDGLSALRACFPAGTVSGAPKIRAMEIIAELETDRRGVYSGAVGYLDFAGGMDTCIALRTMVVSNGVASLQAGGGIVADSSPEGEYAESFHKMRALIRAIERAETIEATNPFAANGA